MLWEALCNRIRDVSNEVTFEVRGQKFRLRKLSFSCFINLKKEAIVLERLKGGERRVWILTR